MDSNVLKYSRYTPGEVPRLENGIQAAKGLILHSHQRIADLKRRKDEDREWIESEIKWTKRTIADLERDLGEMQKNLFTMRLMRGKDE